MAKFCSNCGAPLNESSKVCGNCGKPNPGYVAPAGAPAGTPDGAPKIPNPGSINLGGAVSADKIKQMLPKIIAAVVAIIVVIVAVSTCAANTGYKGTAKSYIKALVAEDEDKAVKLMSEVMMDGSSLDEKDMADSLESTFKFRMESVEDRVGKKVKVKKIEFTDIDKYDKDDLEDFVDELEDSDYDDSDKIKGVVEIEALVNLKGSKKDRDYEMNFVMVKESGKWKIFAASGPYED